MIIKKLIKISNILDKVKLYTEADIIDNFVRQAMFSIDKFEDESARTYEDEDDNTELLFKSEYDKPKDDFRKLIKIDEISDYPISDDHPLANIIYSFFDLLKSKDAVTSTHIKNFTDKIIGYDKNLNLINSIEELLHPGDMLKILNTLYKRYSKKYNKFLMVGGELPELAMTLYDNYKDVYNDALNIETDYKPMADFERVRKRK